MFHVYKKLQDSISSNSCIVILHGGLLEITLKFPSKNGLNKLDRAKSYIHVDLTVLSIFQKVATFNPNFTPYTESFSPFAQILFCRHIRFE